MGIVKDALTKSVEFVKEEILPIRYELMKAGLLTPDRQAYDSKSSLVDPLAYGQTSFGYKEKYSILSYDKCRQITYADPVVASIIQTRTNQVATFKRVAKDKYALGFKIKLRDDDKSPSKAEQGRIKEIEQFIQNCGVPENFEDTPEIRKRDDFETFLRKITRDSLTFDQVNFEIVPRNDGKPYSFLAVDASTIRIIPDKKEMVERFDYNQSTKESQYVLDYGADKFFKEFKPKHPKFCQVINGVKRHVYDEWEMAFGVRNPRTDLYSLGYGFSEIEMLVTTITSHMNAETYNRKFFSQGCLPYEAKIATEFGYIPIGEAFEKGLKGRIWTGCNWTQFDVVETGEKELVETVLSNGQVIKSSPDHRFRVYESDLKLGWKKQSELKPGDYIVADTNGFEIEDQRIGIGKYGRTEGKNHDKSIKIEIKEIKEDLWELLGWIMGDGCIQDRGVTINYHAEDEYEIRESHALVLKKYGIPCYFVDDEREDRNLPKCILSLNYSAFAQFCMALGFSVGKFKGERLPNAVFKTSLKNRKAFLRGLFSADGDSCNNNIKLTSVCEQILRDVQVLMTSVGFQTYQAEDIRLYVNNPIKFLKEIGFVHERKTVSKSRETYGSWICPRLAKDICADVYGPIGERVSRSEGGSVIKDVASRSSLTQSGLSRFRSVAHHGEKISRLMLLKHLHDSGIHKYDDLLSRGFVKVSETKDTNETCNMYDVRCYDDVHEFVVDGVVTHNSSIKGILTFEGMVPPDQLEAFRRQWYAQVTGVNNAWRTPIMALGKDGKMNWQSLHSTNREMEFGKWLEYCIKTICGVFMIDPIEIGFDISKQGSGQNSGSGGLGSGNQGERLEYSKDKGLRPLLAHIESLLNSYIIWRLDPNFELEFVGLNASTEKDDLDKCIQMVKNFKTINEIRAEHDLKPLPDFEKIKNPGDVVLDSSLISFIQGQQAAAAQQQNPEMGGPGPEGLDVQGQGDVSQEPEPDYEKMSVEELQQELQKLEGQSKGQSETQKSQARRFFEELEL
jgi:intein/homing endonuclease